MEILKNFLWALTFFAPRAISVLEQIIQLKGGLPTFHLDYRDPLPIYEQLKQECKRLILSGIIAPGDKLPSVRELAGSLCINPNTIQRAYRELEADGYLISVPGQGLVCRRGAPSARAEKAGAFFEDPLAVTAGNGARRNARGASRADSHKGGRSMIEIKDLTKRFDGFTALQERI